MKADRHGVLCRSGCRCSPSCCASCPRTCWQQTRCCPCCSRPTLKRLGRLQTCGRAPKRARRGWLPQGAPQGSPFGWRPRWRQPAATHAIACCSSQPGGMRGLRHALPCRLLGDVTSSTACLVAVLFRHQVRGKGCKLEFSAVAHVDHHLQHFSYMLFRYSPECARLGRMS